MAHNPWVVISVMGHFVVLAIVSMMVIAQEDTPEEVAPTQLRFADAITKDEPELAPPQLIDRDAVPELQDELIPPNDLTEWIDEREPAERSDDSAVDLSGPPSDAWVGNTPIGVGKEGERGFMPSPGQGDLPGKFRVRPVGDGPRGGHPGGDQIPAHVVLGLDWLANHRDDDGHWDAAGFMKHDQEGVPCDGPGNAVNDVGVTGLALLAFLGAGHTMRHGEHRQVVRDAVKWLREQQGEDGLFGTQASHGHAYSQAIATLAMCEAYGLSNVPALKAPAQRAVDYIQNARNPYGVWRYYPKDGDSDTSVTGWMVLALVSAKDFKLVVDDDALRSALLWFDSVTDPVTGRAGYTRRGEGSSRIQHLLPKFPSNKSECMTAVALLCRIFLGQKPADTPVIDAAADTILKVPPVWNPGDGSIDMCYWYYASFAMFQIGGRRWDAWNKKMTDAVVRSQRDDGNFKGSWDPVDPWGEEGGRVYSTAIMTLCLEVYFRYARVLGGR
jgi:hypothetical protein